MEKDDEQMKKPSAAEDREIPILGNFNTIAGGFSGGGLTHASRKRYVRSVMIAAKIERSMKTLDITFSNEDFKGIIPHEDDPVVLSIVMMGRNVHMVLINQGSSIDVMFWETFVGLQIPIDRLQPFNGMLVDFSWEQVEVRGYADLWTTFRDEKAAKTITVRYIDFNAPSSCNVLLGRPSLNKLRAVVSTPHLKMKIPTNEGKIFMMSVNQEVAKKCYEDSLRIRQKDTYCVISNKGPVDAKLDHRMVHPERRPQLVEEVSVDGKKIKIGGALSIAVEAQILQILQENLSSFA